MLTEISIDRKKTCLYLILTSIVLLLTLFGVSSLILQADAQEQGALQWLNYEQALSKSKAEDIPTMIFFFADNCPWCKKIEAETLGKKEIQQILNKNFSLVKINGDSNESITVNGEKMAASRLSAEIYHNTGFPSIWFLDSTGEKIGNLPGYASPEEFIPILIYISEGLYEEYTFPEYMALRENSH